MELRARLSIAAVVALLAWPHNAGAQGLSLQINNGLVTLEASAVSVRQIFERWQQITGMTVVNADSLPIAPVTLQFANVPERRALETLLRDVPGHIVVRGRGVGAPIDRILIASAASPTSVRPSQIVQTAAAVAPVPTAISEVDAVTPPQTAQPIRLDSAFMNGTGRLEDRVDGVPFVAPVPRTPGITEMPLGTAGAPAPAPPRSLVPPNPFGITSGSPQFGAATPATPPVPATPAADGSVTYRSGGDIVPQEPPR